jgi:hypothetical protein
MPSVMLPYDEFSEYFLEDYTIKQIRKWEEQYATDDEIDDHVGKSVVINYSYGDSKNGKCIINWSFALDEDNKIRTVSYTGSSFFAMWWCGWTDEEEEVDCEYCSPAKIESAATPNIG